jgi:hypothetical protein
MEELEVQGVEVPEGAQVPEGAEVPGVNFEGELEAVETEEVVPEVTEDAIVGEAVLEEMNNTEEAV